MSQSAHLSRDVVWNSLPSQRLAHLQAVYDGAPVGLAFLDRNLRYVNLNQRLAEMNGATVEEHLGKNVAEMVPDAYLRVEPFIRRSLAGESITGVEISRPPGAQQGARYLLLSYEPAHDEGGEVIGVSVAIVDITERKEAEAALRESEDHYRHMVELNPQIPWVLDAEGNALSVSPRWGKLTGLNYEGATGQGYFKATHPDDAQRVRASVAASLQTGDPIDIECRVQSPDGWRWIRTRGAARRDAEGRIIRWYGAAEDITDRKKTEEALRRSEAQMKAIFNSVPIGIILVDADNGKVRMANPEARRIFHNPMPPGYVIGDYKQWGEILVDGKALEPHEFPLTRALRGETTRIDEALCLRGDGSRMWISLLGAPIFRDETVVEGGVVVFEELKWKSAERTHQP